MPMTNAERQKKYRERQLLNNKEEYLKIQSNYKKKKYKDCDLEEIDNENDKEFYYIKT